MSTHSAGPRFEIKVLEQRIDEPGERAIFDSFWREFDDRRAVLGLA